MKMPDRQVTVLVVDGGGRGDVLAEAHARSPHVGKVVVAPGNGLIAWKQTYGKVCVDPNCDLKNADSITAAAKRHRVDYVDVAQDDAVASDAVQRLHGCGIHAFGPTGPAARIEWDKYWQRRFAERWHIPVPDWAPFRIEHAGRAIEYLEARYRGDPDAVLWIKAGGLCAGKGARRAGSFAEALRRIEETKALGATAEIFLIEDGIDGEESSHTAITDGTGFFHEFKAARDHKGAAERGKGGREWEMTGGMGALAPARPIGLSSWEGAKYHLIEKALKGFHVEGLQYKGILYAGAIAPKSRRQGFGVMPFCLEHNARWGDPEAQVIVPGIQNDYFEMMDAAVDGRLREIEIREDALYRVSVAIAARGYPGNSDAARGKRIFGLEAVLKMPDIRVYGAGVIVENGGFYVGGGRLLHIVGEGATLDEAHDRVYAAVEEVRGEDDCIYYRRDIGLLDLRAA